MAKKHFTSGRVFYGPDYQNYYFEVYEPGTSTHKTTYSDVDLTVDNTWPVVLDANGSCSIWFSGDADVLFKTPGGTTVYTALKVNPELSTTTAGGFNLILNGSFEDDTNSDGVPDDWDLTSYTGATNALVTNDQKHGQRAMKFTSTGSGGGYIDTTAYSECSTLTDLDVTFSIKSSVADVRNVVDLLFYDSSKAATSTVNVYDDSVTNPTDWLRISKRITPPNSGFFKLRIYGCHSSDSTSGYTLYDDVVVSRSSPFIGIGLVLALTNQALFI